MGKHSNGLSCIKIKALNRARKRQLKRTIDALPEGSQAKISKFLEREITEHTPIADVLALMAILESSPTSVRYAVSPASISGAQGRRRPIPMMQ